MNIEMFTPHARHILKSTFSLRPTKKNNLIIVIVPKNIIFVLSNFPYFCTLNFFIHGRKIFKLVA